MGVDDAILVAHLNTQGSFGLDRVELEDDSCMRKLTRLNSGLLVVVFGGVWWCLVVVSRHYLLVCCEQKKEGEDGKGGGARLERSACKIE